MASLLERAARFPGHVRLGLVLLAAMALALVIAGPLAGAPGGGGAVARVNGETISTKAFLDRLEQEAGAQVLRQLIAEQLVLQGAREKGFLPDDKAVDAELTRIAGEFGGREALQGVLRQRGMTLDDLRHQVRVNLALRNLQTEGVTVTDKEVRDYFESNKDRYATPARVDLAQITTKTEEEARSVIAALDKGTSFEELARERSTDRVSGEQGGRLGWVTREQLPAAVATAAFALDAGEHTKDPVRVDGGYAVLLVRAKREEEPASFEAVREQVREELLARKAKPVEELVSGLQEQAEIVILREPYRSAAGGGSGSGD